MKTDLDTARTRTKDAVGQITSWCIIIAMHQKFGIGAARINRIAAAMNELQQRYVMELTHHPKADAMYWLRSKLPACCCADFPVPLNRVAKNRREEQLRMAANEAAGVAWCLFAIPLHEELGFGKDRLEALRQEAIGNYRQFNEWSREDKEWAWGRLKHCAEAAVREEMELVDIEEADESKKLAFDGLTQQDRRAVHLAVTTGLARSQRPAGWAVMNPRNLIENAKMEVLNHDQSSHYQFKGRRG